MNKYYITPCNQGLLIFQSIENGYKLVSKFFLEGIEQALQKLNTNTVYMFECDFKTDYDLFVKQYLEARGIQVIIEKEVE